MLVLVKSFRWIVVLAALSTGCSKNPDILFEIPMQLDFTISPGLSPFEKHFYLVQNVPTNMEVLKEQFSVTENQELVLRPGSAVLRSFSRVDFDFVQEVTISVYETDKDDDTEIFFNNQIPFNAGRNVFINPIDRDYRDEVDRETLNFKIGLRFRSITPTSIDSNIEIVFTAE
ncbi:MAG: hypothetical protein HKN87_06935 [Saprospiraceae bacterium]|nr:hypothetical protein [Saprospiraceae bacterium]